jgi:hypothetical protein
MEEFMSFPFWKVIQGDAASLRLRYVNVNQGQGRLAHFEVQRSPIRGLLIIGDLNRRRDHRQPEEQFKQARHFGEAQAANAVERVIGELFAKPEFRTPDVGGKATTEIVGKAIAERLAG